MKEYMQREYIVYLACSKCSINNNSISISNCCHCCYDDDNDDDDHENYNDKTHQMRDNHSHLAASWLFRGISKTLCICPVRTGTLQNVNAPNWKDLLMWKYLDNSS